MNRREAYQALLDGKKVRAPHFHLKEFLLMDEDGRIVDEKGTPFAEMVDDCSRWDIHEEPATDAELAAEWRKRARLFEAQGQHGVSAELLLCARMLEARTVRP